MRARLPVFPRLFMLPLLAASLVFVAACGETRRAPGEECLRGEDCLSGTCTERICVATPAFGQPTEGSSDAATSEVVDAGARDSGGVTDASGE